MRPMRNIINSVKNQRQESVTYAGSDANNVYNVYVGVGRGETATTVNIPVGSMVYSVNVSMNYVNSSASLNTTLEWMIVKFRDGQNTGGEFGTPSGASWSTIGLSDARNQVIKSYLAVATPSIGGRYVHNEQVSIPKIYQRVREGDVLAIVFNATQAGLLSIGTRYKWYT